MLHLTHFGMPALKKELKLLLSLAIPILLTQIAQVGTGFVDTVMAGGAGTDDLAAVALGGSLFATIFISLIGITVALNPILSQAYGARQNNLIGEIGRQGLWLGLYLGLFGMIIMWLSIDIFKAQFDLASSTLQITGDYLFFVGLAMPAAMLHRALLAYAISLDKPAPVTVISFIGFFLNIPLNYAFVYGKWGMPELGGAGCGLATAIVFWVNAILLFGYIAKSRYFTPFGLTDRWSKPNMARQKEFLKLGIPIGLSFFIEVSLFTCIMFLVAKLPTGDTPTEKFVAAQQIVISLTSLIFIIPQSIGVASTTRVGFCLGRRHFTKARYSSGVAIAFAIFMSVMTALLLILAKEPLAKLYTDDMVVIGIATSLLIFASAFQLVDAIQCVASSSLRGYQLAKLPMLIHAVSFWGVGLLPGYYLAFYQGMGIYGFWWALVASLGVAACLLGWYLEVHSKKVIAQNRLRVVD